MEPVTLNNAQILAHANTTNAFAFRLLQALQQAKGREKSLAVSPVSLYFANAAFFHVGYVPTEQFKRLVDTFYEAETTMLDFNSDTGFDQVNEFRD